MHKPPKSFDFPETERSFKFVWFKEFPWFVTLGERMVLIAFLAFYLAIKLWQILVWKIFTKIISNMANSSKNLQKISQCFNGDTQKEPNINRGTEVLINKVFDSVHKEKIKKAGEAITPLVDTVKPCGRQNI